MFGERAWAEEEGGGRKGDGKREGVESDDEDIDMMERSFRHTVGKGAEGANKR